MTRTVTMPDDLRDRVHSSMMHGMPMTITYRDDDGKAVTTYRGSTHAHADDRLAIWARSPQGGLQRAASRNAQVDLVYRNPHTGSFVHFTGTARIAATDALNARIFDDTPPMEQATDPGRKGIGIIVDLHRIAGAFQGRTLLIEN